MEFISSLGSIVKIIVVFLLFCTPSTPQCFNCFRRAVALPQKKSLQETPKIELQSKSPFRMDILHINDMHSRLEQTNRLSGACKPYEAKNHICVGGFARVATVIKQAREAAERKETPPVLVLNAGDNFQGSIYYTLFRSRIMTKFINMLGFDALTLGNHEFDDGLEELNSYLRNVKSPIVAANVDLSKARKLEGYELRPSVVVEVGGQKVGIIGYLTRETVADKVEITDEITAVKKEAKRLTEQGIKIIVALGHSGFNVDKQVALEVPEIDVVVGAHSHTFLYNETLHPLPDPQDKPTGMYPTIVTQASGKKVPVVQAYAFTKYIGRLSVEFDKHGEVTSMEGNPVLLDDKIPEDEQLLNELNQWRDDLVFFNNKVEGSTPALLESTHCRQRECNIGNVIADALIHHRVKTLPNDSIKGWTDAPIALVNAGNIRNSIDARSRNNSVTYRDIIEAIPYRDFIHIVKLKGKDLIEILEHSVSQYDPTQADQKGGFLQVSGLQVTYNIDKPSGQRVESVLARCSECHVPSYYPLQNDRTYSVLMTTFMVDGGDGYSMVRCKGDVTALDDTGTGQTEMTALKTYFNDMSPVYAEVGFRIIIKGGL